MDYWNIKTDNVREANSKKTFIIFCEDGSVEPAYFDLFESENVQISAIGNSKQHHAQVDLATEYFRKNDLIELNEGGKEVLKIDEGAQVWCVFDRDKNEGDGKDTAFNDSITNAQAKGIRTAWSNDDFELWILLHFEEVNPSKPENQNRARYYSRLSEILKNLFPKEAIFQNPQFNYYDAMKGKKRFLRFTYQCMKANLDTAIDRAKKLEAFHANPIKPPHLQCPCTKVHHLVKELLMARKIGV